MADLTIIYYTLNRMPKHWQDFHLRHLTQAVQYYPVITVSRLPTPIGMNLIDTETPSYSNIYRQLLRAAELAKTPYVATAEDDVLYPKEHYNEFRPADDEFSYNRSRWSVFSWEKDKAIYCLRNRISNCSLIAPTRLLITCLRERFEKFAGSTIPESLMGECGRFEKRIGIPERKMKEWWSTCPLIHLNHPDGTDLRQSTKRKSHGQLKALTIPFWGAASSIAAEYR